MKVSAWPITEWFVRRTFLFKGLVRRFIAGDTLQEALIVAEELSAKGLNVTLDLLGESVASQEEAVNAKCAYIDMLRAIAASSCRSRTNISIKLTQCGLDISEEFAEGQFREVLEVARELDLFVRVDMEASEYTQRTIEMILRCFQDFPVTGTVLQTYLYRTPADVDLMIEKRIRTRLVKGAYLEPESVAFPEKAKVDAAYVELGKRLMEHGNYPALATHDEAIIEALKAFATEKNISKERFEWQMLFGIRRDLQDSLAAEGYPVRVYVPFGDSWYPYFSRRLAERPANMFFILKSLFKG
ncbi:MAG TPA: proline dehydrogenase family protein [Fimbriimonadaceae bacterium]|nr:proline dehydrogenase family protein [Fimbriimonadaceae bacterium]